MNPQVPIRNATFEKLQIVRTSPSSLNIKHYDYPEDKLGKIVTEDLVCLQWAFWILLVGSMISGQTNSI